MTALPTRSKPRRRSLVRRLGFSRLAVDQWLRRGVFLLGGLCVGGAAVLMAVMADKAQELFAKIIGHAEWLALLVTPVGFAVCVLLARTVFPNSQGSGIPQVIAARQIDDAKLRYALVSLRTSFGKIVVMMIGLLCGASIGREGPTVQVGASIMGFIGRKAPVVYQQNLLLAGAAAGIAAAFNTPLAGIVFGIEELSRSFEAKASGWSSAASSRPASPRSRSSATTPISARPPRPCRSAASGWSCRSWRSPAACSAACSRGS